MKKENSNQNMKILDEMFHRIINKMNSIEKVPRYFGTSFLLHRSEIHTIETIGRNPGINVTELAKIQGVTKGAVSQVLSKLDKKKLIIKMKEIDNERKICIKLSKEGLKAFEGHNDFHSNIHYPLVELVENSTKEEIEYTFRFLSVIEEFCDKIIEEDV